MATVEELNVIVNAKTTAAKKDLKKFEGQMDKTEKSAKNLAKSMLKRAAAGAVAAVAVNKLISLGKESIDLYGAQVQAEEKLAAAIRTTGGDVEELLPRYKDLASEIQNVTTVGDESSLALIQQAKSMGVADDQIESATKGAIGLSKALGIGTQQAIRGVSNALNGEFTTLQRYIPALRTTEDESEKLAIVQQAMADGFETAKAEADNAYGTIQQYENAMGDLKEQLGQTAAEGIQPFVKGLKNIVEEMAASIKNTREFKEFVEFLDSGGDIADLGMGELEKSLSVATKELERMQVAVDGLGFSTVKISNQKALIESIEQQIKATAELTKWQGIENKELERQAKIAADVANMNRIAAEQRVKINDDYKFKLSLLKEEDETQREIMELEAKRAEAIDEANSKYVRTGTEINLINDYFDELIEKQKEAARGGAMSDFTARINASKNLYQAEHDRIMALKKEDDDMMASMRSQFSELTMSREQRLDQQVEAFRAAKVDEVALDKWAADERKKLEDELQQERIAKTMESVNSIYSAYQGMLSGISYMRQSAHDAEIARIDAQIEAALEAGRDTTAMEDKKDKIMQKYKRKQFAADKRGKLLAAGMNIAQAITEALGPTTAWMIPIISAMGAAQIGTIAAAKNPYYAGGVIPEPVLGVGMRSGQSYSFGERGPETVIPNGGSMGGGITVNINAAIGSRDEITEWVVEGINRAKKMGAVAIA